MKPEAILNPAFDGLVKELSALNDKKQTLLDGYRAKQEEFKKIHEEHKVKIGEVSASISKVLEQISKLENPNPTPNPKP